MIEVYSWATPNGHKIHIMLEECGLAYRAIPIDIGAGAQFTPEFLAISPNNKIPAIVDPDGPDGRPIFLANHAGGVAGGIATGQPVVVRVALKPTSSILTPVETITRDGAASEIRTKGRHDPCVGIRAVPVVEAMVALVLADQKLLQRAQVG